MLRTDVRIAATTISPALKKKRFDPLYEILYREKKYQAMYTTLKSYCVFKEGCIQRLNVLR